MVNTAPGPLRFCIRAFTEISSQHTEAECAQTDRQPSPMQFCKASSNHSIHCNETELVQLQLGEEAWGRGPGIQKAEQRAGRLRSWRQRKPKANPSHGRGRGRGRAGMEQFKEGTGSYNWRHFYSLALSLLLEDGLREDIPNENK